MINIFGTDFIEVKTRVFPLISLHWKQDRNFILLVVELKMGQD